MRNLLGRLNTRKTDDLRRIAAYWHVPLTGDRGRQIGLLYRTLSDVRAARTILQQLDANESRVVRELAATSEGSLPLAEIARRVEIDEDLAREVAIRLFRNGLLAREGDSQELPVGVLPRLFLPRELGLVFRRVFDEIGAGDISGNPIQVVLESLSLTTIEQAATRWGINVIPGLRTRDELIGQILRQITADRVRRLVEALDIDARRIWDVMDERSIGGTLPLDDVLEAAGLRATSSDAGRATQARDALDVLETSLLVLHTYDRKGNRSLFVPHEIRHPTAEPVTVPARPLVPLDAKEVGPPRERHPHALAWDLLTVLREIANHGAPIWVPGDPVSRSWQRRLNGRLWFGGEELPPEGYAGFLLQLALAVGLIQRTAPPPGTHADRHAIVPVVSPMIREWRSRSFAEQSARLRQVWLTSNEWIEARERGDVDVWGPDWRGFRRKLLEAVTRLEAGEWFLLRELSRRWAESDPALIGTAMTVASSSGSGAGEDREEGRISATALIIRLEVETALNWFGIVETGSVSRRGLAVRVTDHGMAVATDPEEPGVEDRATGAALEVTEAGTVVVRQPSPLHLWSMSAFADAADVSLEPVFQLRSGSVGRALGAGFDLEHIVTYLERHSGAALPEGLRSSLAQWSAGYKRVRMRHAMLLTPDAGTSRADLERLVRDRGLDVLAIPDDPESLFVVFPPSNEDATTIEESLLAALRAGGYLGQWAMPAPGSRSGRGSR